MCNTHPYFAERMRIGTTKVHLRIVKVCAGVGCGEGELGADSWTNILIFVFSAFLRPEAAVVGASAASASHHGVKEVWRHASQV